RKHTNLRVDRHRRRRGPFQARLTWEPRSDSRSTTSVCCWTGSPYRIDCIGDLKISGKLYSPSSAGMPDPRNTKINTSTAKTNAPLKQPPYHGFIASTHDALVVIGAARRGFIPFVPRRLSPDERTSLIASGAVFVFQEPESGIKRWTDGYVWSASRMLGNFMLYREREREPGRQENRGKRKRPWGPEGDELEDDEDAEADEDEKTITQADMFVPTQPPVSRPRGDKLSRPKSLLGSTRGVNPARERNLLGSLTNSKMFKDDSLMKKVWRTYPCLVTSSRIFDETFSLKTASGTTIHLIAYYRPSDVEAGRLRAPSSVPELAAFTIDPELLEATAFRCPPKIEHTLDGTPLYRGESDQVIASLSMGGPIGTTPGSEVFGTRPVPNKVRLTSTGGRVRGVAIAGTRKSHVSDETDKRFTQKKPAALQYGSEVMPPPSVRAQYPAGPPSAPHPVVSTGESSLSAAMGTPPWPPPNTSSHYYAPPVHLTTANMPHSATSMAPMTRGPPPPALAAAAAQYAVATSALHRPPITSGDFPTRGSTDFPAPDSNPHLMNWY
ncbi:unnamed protein product, partial [Mycena citricolor]